MPAAMLEKALGGQKPALTEKLSIVNRTVADRTVVFV